jgi:hypothetical protein
LLKVLSRPWFERLARRHVSGRRKRELSDWGHLVAMVFAQAGGARSLRDLERLLERHPVVKAHLDLGEVITAAQAMPIEPGATYVFDKGNQPQHGHHPDHGCADRLSSHSHRSAKGQEHIGHAGNSPPDSTARPRQTLPRRSAPAAKAAATNSPSPALFATPKYFTGQQWA